MNYTYIVKCADGTYYTGWTNDLEERVRAHNAGEGAKYTKARRPVELAYYEEYGTKSEAMKREWAIKQLTRTEKEELVRAGAKRKRKAEAAKGARAAKVKAAKDTKAKAAKAVKKGKKSDE